MKACLWFMVFWVMGLSVALAQRTIPDDVEYNPGEKGICLNAENIELSMLIKLIAVQERVNITSSGPLSGNVCVNLYDCTVEQILDAVLKPNGYGYLKQNGGYLIMKTEEMQTMSTPPSQMITRIFQLNYMNLDEAEKFITPVLSEGGKLVLGEKPRSGITTGDVDAGGDSSASYNTLLVRDYEEVIEEVARILEELDVRPRQVLVEATILEVILDDSSVLGVDFNALGGINFTDLDSTSNIFSVDMGEATGTQLKRDLFAMQGAGFAEDNPTEGFSLGILHDKIGVFIEALENVVDSNVIANPKIIALNRQRAEIIIGGRLGYYGQSTISDGLSQQSVEFLETGTQLRFRPYISNDGFVRLEIHPQRSSGVVDSSTGLPSENTSEVTTNIMVKDGDTVVIGGLIEEQDTLNIKRVPLLGTLPLIGWLFRREENETRRTEIIILITPYILDPAEGDEKAEEELLAFEQRKKLFREGFLFCSRTIYAERHVAKAREYLQTGDLKWARYHIHRAATLNAFNRDVAPLKERIEEASDRERTSGGSMDEYLRSELQ